jgi:hypothetical protein
MIDVNLSNPLCTFNHSYRFEDLGIFRDRVLYSFAKRTGLWEENQMGIQDMDRVMLDPHLLPAGGERFSRLTLDYLSLGAQRYSWVDIKWVSDIVQPPFGSLPPTLHNIIYFCYVEIEQLFKY